MGATKWVYDFSEGNKDQKDLLGGKGANLAEMTNLGLPVPPGFTITTDACRYYLEHRETPPDLADQVSEHLTALEKSMGKGLGDPADPLLVSVRSGAAASMPGMMETVLNVGLNDESVQGLAGQSGSERFASLGWAGFPRAATPIRQAPRRVSDACRYGWAGRVSRVVRVAASRELDHSQTSGSGNSIAPRAGRTRTGRLSRNRRSRAGRQTRVTSQPCFCSSAAKRANMIWSPAPCSGQISTRRPSSASPLQRG